MELEKTFGGLPPSVKLAILTDLNSLDSRLEDIEDINPFHFEDGIDCSTNPNYPASTKGEVRVVTVAGRIGGALGAEVEIGDLLYCKATTIAGTEAEVGTKFVIVQGNNPVVTPTNEFFVDGARTDSYTPDGSKVKPYLTVKAAVEAVEALYTAAVDKQTTKYAIKIMPGTYSDAFEITTMKHLRFEGIGVDLSGAITITQSPIGGSGQEPYTRIEFVGHNGIRAEKGAPMIISGNITATRTNDSLTYINFKGCYITGNQLYDGDGTWVTHYENCRVNGTIDTGTFVDADSTVLVETTGWNEFAGAITDKVTFYNLNNVDFYGAVAITPIFDCTMVNTRFFSTVSIIASKNLYMDGITMKSMYARTPTLTGMTVLPLDGIAEITVPVSAAQIIGMKDAPVTLVPAVTGKTIVIDDIVIKMTTTATQFANGTAVEFRYTDGSGDKVTADLAAGVINAAEGVSFTILKAIVTALTGVISAPIIMTNATTAFDTGTGTALITVRYHLV